MPYSSSKFKDLLSLEKHIKEVNTIESDYKSEVVIANLINEGYDPKRIFPIRKGNMRRGFDKDIDSIELMFSQYELRDHLYVNINRDGLYDMLPEKLFHKSNDNRNKTKEDILREIKRHREKEFFARKFFQIFEIELDKYVANIYLYELLLDKRISNRNFANVFLHYWPMLKDFTSEQVILFLYVIPILHKIRNRHSEVEEVMSVILDVPVTISAIRIPQQIPPGESAGEMGAIDLGVNFVLGNEFDDGIDDIKITVGPISAQKMEYFLSPNPGSIILDKLCSMFLTADAYFIKDFKICSEDSALILSDNPSSASRVGINSFI